MKNYFALTFNLAYWLCYYSLIGIVFMLAIRFTNSPPTEIVWNMVTGLIIIPSTLSFYSMYFGVFPKHFNHGKWLNGATAMIGFTLASALLGFIYLFFIAQIGEFSTTTGSTIIGVFSTLCLVAFVNQIMAWVIIGFITWQKEFKLKAKLKQQNFESQLALIRSKMDPHFLFNSLNNIDVLVQDNPTKGSEYLNKLSDIIRFMMYETQKENIPLSKELDYLKEYIELQKIRSVNEHFVTLNIEGSAEGKLMPPVVFIPFVENAFKHCGNKKESGAIDISIKIKANSIEFACNNSIGKPSEKQNQPMGNSLIKERLNLLLPNAHKLEIKETDNRFSVNLSMHV